MSQPSGRDIPIRSYGRRRGKGMKKPGRVEAMEAVLPRAQITLPESKTDPRKFFSPAVKEAWFEIGFGNGEHVLHQALHNPDIGIIGCEPFMDGVGALCVGVVAQRQENIRIWPDDARLLMAQMADASLSRIYLLHPDPWPKSRHHKRRFIQTETLDEFARLLKPGAELRMATDHVELSKWMLEKAINHPAFQWTAKSADDWRNPPADWTQTRYCRKGLTQGRPPVYLNFKRV